MGYFLNTEIIDNCILLAQEAFNEGNFEVCRAFLESANAAFIVFPSMSEKGFDYISELFSACRESLPAEERKLIKQFGILTTLSNIMSRTAHARASPTKVRICIRVPSLNKYCILRSFSNLPNLFFHLEWRFYKCWK